MIITLTFFGLILVFVSYFAVWSHHGFNLRMYWLARTLEVVDHEIRKDASNPHSRKEFVFLTLRSRGHDRKFFTPREVKFTDYSFQGWWVDTGEEDKGMRLLCEQYQKVMEAERLLKTVEGTTEIEKAEKVQPF